jgi:hypothetical protein
VLLSSLNDLGAILILQKSGEHSAPKAPIDVTRAPCRERE